MEEANTSKAWTADEIEEIWNRYQNGEGPSALAEAYNKSVGSIKGVIRRRKEKNSNESLSKVQPVPEETEAQISAVTEDIEVDDVSEPDEREICDSFIVFSLARTYVKPSLIRPRRKEFGRLYTGISCRMRKKR